MQKPIFCIKCLLASAVIICIVAVPMNERAAAQSTRVPTSTAVSLPTVGTATPRATETEPAPSFRFATPAPRLSESPLSGASEGISAIPSVFENVNTYSPIAANLSTDELALTSASTVRGAVPSVVKIFRCDEFGCATPVGSGVIVHPSGLILTAYHVLLEDPNDLTSQRHDDFVIALVNGVRASPSPRYRASLVADKNEQDIALMAIDRDLDGNALDRNGMNLPALPIADVDQLFGDTLQVLGFPVRGGDAINVFPAIFTSFDDDGELIVVDRSLGQGNSGGPALVLQDDRLAVAGLVIRARSIVGNLQANSLLRAVDQASRLNWTPKVDRVLGQNVQVAQGIVDDESLVQISVDVSTFDLVGERLRLIFYATETETGQPWQPPNVDAPLAIWGDLTPQTVFDVRTVRLSIASEELGIDPAQLTFHGLLWNPDNEIPLWSTGELGVQLDEDAVIVVQEEDAPVTPTRTPSATIPATSPPTQAVTPTPSIAPTVNVQATADAIETAAFATLEVETTPTLNPIAIRLTEIAQDREATATELPTVTSTNTPTAPLPSTRATATSSPTSPPISTATRTLLPPSTDTLTPVPLGINCNSNADPVFSAIWQEYRSIIGCPTSSKGTIPVMAEEIFQGGHMFWRSDSDEVYVIYDRTKDGSNLFSGSWQTNPSWKWDGSNPDGIGLSPPSGLVEPKRGFGWVWRNFLGREGGQLGWALDREYGFNNIGQFQYFENGIMFKGSDLKTYALLHSGQFYARLGDRD